MISTISFSYPWWFLLLCLVLALVYAYLMYHNEQKFDSQNSILKWIMAVLRTLAVFFIAILLLSPFIKSVTDDIKQPIILIARDMSESMRLGNVKQSLESTYTALDNLKSKLEQNYKVVDVTFGVDVHEQAKEEPKDVATNLSALFKYVGEHYADQNLGAMILATDGIFNEGSNPLYSEDGINAQVYTVAMGDTTKRKDLFFQNILYNRLAYLGDKFTIQFDIEAYNAQGNTNLILERIVGGQITKIQEIPVNINSNSFFTTKSIVVEASSVGMNRYRARLSTVPGESNVKNNSKDFYIEVLDGRQKLLLLANAPHPDLSALKTIISKNKNYIVDIQYVKDDNLSIAGYNMVVFHNLPSENYDLKAILTQLDKNGIPRIFIVGMQTQSTRFNAAQDLVNITTSSNNLEDVQADINPGFSLYTISDRLKDKMKNFPPLKAPFGQYTAEGTAQIFLYQNIKRIKTNYPLLAFGEKNGIKTAVFVGEGLWQWRLVDFYQHQNYDIVEELIGKLVLYTSIKTDTRRFRVSTSKNLYKDSEKIFFDGQLYNKSYEMVNDPDVKLSIKDENKKEYTYSLSKTQNYYTLDAGLLSQGEYSYTASVTYEGKVETVSGKFSVESVSLEDSDLLARHGLLQNISEKFNGKMIYPNQINDLYGMVMENKNIKPVLYESRFTNPIINIKWLFFILLALLAAEWFMRRYYGSY